MNQSLAKYTWRSAKSNPNKYSVVLRRSCQTSVHSLGSTQPFIQHTEIYFPGGTAAGALSSLSVSI